MSLSMQRWVSKVAIVTGASSGIGAAICVHLVEQGVIVAGFARRKERVEELSKKLSSKKGKLHAVRCDVTKEQDIKTAFKWVQDNLGPVHILVNNAGVVCPTTLYDGDTEMWKKIFDTNVMGLCICTREAIKIMRENNIDGHIVHINSVAGHTVPNIEKLNVYAGSKHAVTALTETLRQELNRLNSKIKISSVSPGAVLTDILNTEDFKSTEAGIDFSKIPILRPEDVADATVYILSTPPNVQIQELTIKPVNEQF